MHNMGEIKHSHISAIGDMDLPLCHALPLDSSFLWSFLDISLDSIKPSTEWSYNEIRLVTTCNNHYAGCARIEMCKYHLIIAHLGLTRNEVYHRITEFVNTSMGILMTSDDKPGWSLEYTIWDKPRKWNLTYSYQPSINEP
jgi:hypothetical protein